ncbi:MAG TPA: tetratricopeptide repeat protein, partial [Stellaceae bacterium]|nr:tetratricopeptide repeat protein [Stellaceae bacterium]
FLAHEILRPGFMLARLTLRHGAPRLRRRRGGGIARGDHARDQGRWDLAARHYRQALEQMPTAPAIWVQYGHALKESGELAAAEAAYRRAIALDPQMADTYLQLGHALKLQGRPEEAAAAYAACLARDPASSHAQSELAALGWTGERIAGLGGAITVPQ